MERTGRKQVLLLGLEDGLLWQLTKALAAFEDLFEVHCARDFSVAGEICARGGAFDVIVVDGWEQSWQAGYSMGWDRVAGMQPRKWVILVDCMPMAGLLDDQGSPSAVFLEKPINPKEFPPFLLDLLERQKTEPPPAASPPETGGPEPAEERVDLKGHFFLPGERYLPPAGQEALETRGGTVPEECGATPVEEPGPAAGEWNLGSTSDSGSTHPAPVPEPRNPCEPEPPAPRVACPKPAAGSDLRDSVSPTEPCRQDAPSTLELRREDAASAAEPGAQEPFSVPPAAAGDFHSLLDSGFACLRRKDYPAAHRNWEEALRLRPRDKRLQANLLRLESLMAVSPEETAG